MAGSYPLYIGNVNNVEVVLTDPKNNDDPILDAMPTITVTDVAGTPVDGATWPLSMNNLTGGLYDVDLPKTLVLEEWTPYVGAIVDNAKGIDLRLPYVAQVRTGTKPSQERMDWVSGKAGTL